MNKRIAAVVLTYHPSEETVENIKVILNQVSRVYLVNNEMNPQTENLFSGFVGHAFIEFINFTQNSGVAAGFNAGIKKAIDDGFHYVVLFDQDSFPEKGMVPKLLNVHETQGGHTGIIGPKLRDQKTGHFFDKETGTCTRDLIISSGSFFSANLVHEIGFFDEFYFIDYVDHEYCLRARAAGKINYIVNDATLQHQFGNPVAKRFMGHLITVSNYPPLRHFYMMRNRIFLLRKYGAGKWFWTDLFHLLKMWVKIGFFEQDKFKKFLSAVKGLLCGCSKV